jgi:hypothetical protein
MAHVAQLAERVLGKDEVTSSILVVGSMKQLGVGEFSVPMDGLNATTDGAAVQRFSR